MTASEIFEIVTPGAAATVDASLIYRVYLLKEHCGAQETSCPPRAIHVKEKLNACKMGVK